MAAVSSTFVDPSVNFVWWIEGDKIAIATTDGDGGTSETAQGRYKAPIIGSSTDYITSGMLISYYAEPDKIDNSSGTGISATIDLDNSLHTALIAYVKSRALMDAAARETDPAQAPAGYDTISLDQRHDSKQGEPLQLCCDIIQIIYGGDMVRMVLLNPVLHIG